MLSSTSVSLPSLAIISRNQTVVTLGSCFADHIGQRFVANKWTCVSNPFGTLYQPLAITGILELVLGDRPLPDDGYLERDGGIFHYDLPSTLYGRTRKELSNKVRGLGEQIRRLLEQPGWLMLTLGTSFAYRHKESGLWVANCHKQEGSLFSKHLLNLEEIHAAWRRCEELIPAHTRILWTLSPVRHTRDTLPLNMVSKSLLRIWIHQMTERDSTSLYFPAYEILLDEWRDYRFYADDLIHPRESTIECLWQRFQEAYFDAESRDFVKCWEKILLRLAHRPIRPEAPSYRAFLLDTLRELQQFDSLDTTAEQSALEAKLQNLR